MRYLPLVCVSLWEQNLSKKLRTDFDEFFQIRAFYTKEREIDTDRDRDSFGTIQVVIRVPDTA